MSRHTCYRESFAAMLFWIFVSGIVLVLPLVTSAEEVAVFEVTATHDGNRFSYEWSRVASFAAYDVYALRFPSPIATELEANNIVPAFVYLPRQNDGGKQIPAVLCLHILSGNRELMELVCSALASRGVAGMTFPLPYYGERGPEAGPRVLLSDPRLLVQAIHQAWADIRRAVDILASRPEIDPNKISILGISFGGIVAVGAAAEEPRFWRVLPILAGGDLPRIIQHAPEARALREAFAQMPPEKQERFLALLQSVDPLRYAEKLRPKAEAGRVWMINATEDEVIPRECTERLAQALGIAEQVWWLEGVGHYTSLSKLPEVVDRTVAFFAQDIPTGSTKPSGYQTSAKPSGYQKAARSPEEKLSRLLTDLSKLILGEPEGETGYRVELEGKLKTEKVESVHLRFIRGAKGRFFLSANVPSFGSVTLGQHTVPWMASAKGVVFVGNPALKGPGAGDLLEEIQSDTSGRNEIKKSSPSEGSSERVPTDGPCHEDPLRFAQPRYRDQVRMVAGILAAVALAPQLLERQGVTLKQNQLADGIELLVQLPPSLERGEIKIFFPAEDSVPRRCHLALAGWEAELNILTWEIDKPIAPQSFLPPEGASVKEVSCYEIHRVFGALFNFGMANLER